MTRWQSYFRQIHCDIPVFSKNTCLAIIHYCNSGTEGEGGDHLLFSLSFPLLFRVGCSLTGQSHHVFFVFFFLCMAASATLLHSHCGFCPYCTMTSPSLMAMSRLHCCLIQIACLTLRTWFHDRLWIGYATSDTVLDGLDICILVPYCKSLVNKSWERDQAMMRSKANSLFKLLNDSLPTAICIFYFCSWTPVSKGSVSGLKTNSLRE